MSPGHPARRAQRARPQARDRPARPCREPLRRHEEPRHVRDARGEIYARAHRGIEQITLDRGRGTSRTS
jgi:hypothetical protein